MPTEDFVEQFEFEPIEDKQLNKAVELLEAIVAQSRMILGIESSCDESALKLLDRSKGIVGEWVSSQVTLHAEYGGVVPELASREHLSIFAPLLRELRKQYSFAEIDEIVVTAGPGWRVVWRWV